MKDIIVFLRDDIKSLGKFAIRSSFKIGEREWVKIAET